MRWFDLRARQGAGLERGGLSCAEPSSCRIVDDTGLILPTSFGDFVFTAVLPNGTVIEGSEPGGEQKGGGNVERRSPRPTVTCTFAASFTLPEDDPEFGLPAGTVVTFSGQVTGFLTGR